MGSKAARRKIGKEPEVKQQNTFYPYAKDIFSEFKSEYQAECDRENTINTKASTYITIIFVIITIMIPVIPFDLVFKYWKIATLLKRVLFCGLSALLLAGLVVLICALYQLFKVYSITNYNRVNIDDLVSFSKETESSYEERSSQIYCELVEHYYIILRGNKERKIEGNIDINSRKAKRVRRGLCLMTIGFAIFSVSSILLKIFVVVK